jgi:hypothetical protein
MFRELFNLILFLKKSQKSEKAGSDRFPLFVIDTLVFFGSGSSNHKNEENATEAFEGYSTSGLTPMSWSG